MELNGFQYVLKGMSLELPHSTSLEYCFSRLDARLRVLLLADPVFSAAKIMF